MTGGETLVQCLIAQGVKAVFGMPGGHLEQIYDALYRHQDKIKHILIRNEQAASLAADGYARASGRPGVCLVIPGPGASNAATGIAEAASASSPVLLITSQNEPRIAEKEPSRQFHGLDHERLFAPMTRLCRVAGSADEIPDIVRDAFSILRSGRPGPVALIIPKNVLLEQATEKKGTGTFCRNGPEGASHKRCLSPFSPDEDQIARAAEMIAGAQRPVIIAGGGVLFTKACDLVGDLAERLSSPVVTTQNARGALSDAHPLSLGDIADHAARAAILEADLALALGCRFVHFDTGGWTMKLPKLIHIEADASHIGADYETAIGIAADVRPSVERLLHHLREMRIKSSWEGRIETLRSERDLEKPIPIISALRRALPPETIVVGDVHMTAYRMRRAYKVTRPGEYFASNSFCTLGYALPAALGAKVAFPERPVVAVCGDGGFIMTCQELATAAQFGINVIAVILNDNCLTSIKMGQDKRCERRFIAVDLENPSFPALAAAFGLEGYRAENDAELEDRVAAALRAQRAAVIEMPIEKRY